jgi:hypothetical protein
MSYPDLDNITRAPSIGGDVNIITMNFDTITSISVLTHRREAMYIILGNPVFAGLQPYTTASGTKEIPHPA